MIPNDIAYLRNLGNLSFENIEYENIEFKLLISIHTKNKILK